MEISVLVIRDDEDDVGDDGVTSSGVAEGGTCAGRSREVTRIGLGTTPIDGIRAIHVESWNRTSEELGTVGNSWVLRIQGTPVTHHTLG